MEISGARARLIAAPPGGMLAGNSLAGIGLTLLSVTLFACCNAVAKYLVMRFPVGEMLFVRSAVALLLILPLLRRADLAAMRRTRPELHLLRSLCSGVEVGCYYWAITLLPLADASTIYLAGPIYITALSVFFLSEQVGWRRWAAVLVGFAGVIVAVRPSGAGLSLHAGVALFGSLLYAISQVVTRGLRGTPTSLLVATQMAALLVLSAGTSLWGWTAPNGWEGAMMVLIGVLAMVAYFCANRGLQLAPASVVAPFQYASIIGAVALGYGIFDEIPSASTLAGAAIIVGAGCFILAREKRVGVATVAGGATSGLVPPP